MGLIKVVPLLAVLSVMTWPCSASNQYKQTSFGYDKSVLMDLCQFVGVKYIRNPDSPECGYIACWDRTPYHMPCAPGLKVHQLFFWGSGYPCTEVDRYNRCQYVKDFMMDGSENTSNENDIYQNPSRHNKGIHTKQGPRAMSSETYESYDKLQTRKPARKTHESVHGAGQDLYQRQFPAVDKSRSNNIHQPPTIRRGYGDTHDDKIKLATHRHVMKEIPHVPSRSHVRSYAFSQPTNPYVQQGRPQFAPPNRVDYVKRRRGTSAATTQTTLPLYSGTEDTYPEITTELALENILNSAETTETITSSTSAATTTHASDPSTTVSMNMTTPE